MADAWVKMKTLIQHDWCPYKRRKYRLRDRHAWRESDVKKQERHLQTKQRYTWACQNQERAPKQKEQTLPSLRFQTVSKYTSVALSHKDCGTLLWQPRKWMCPVSGSSSLFAFPKNAHNQLHVPILEVPTPGFLCRLPSFGNSNFSCSPIPRDGRGFPQSLFYLNNLSFFSFRTLT